MTARLLYLACGVRGGSLLMREALVQLPTGLQILRRLPLPHKLGLLERVYGATLAKCGCCFVETATGVPWKLNLLDPCQRWIVFGWYGSKETVSWVRHWLKDGGIVVDSGVNVGQFLLHYGDLPVQVLAIDALPEALESVRESLKLHPTWNVSLIHAGLADKPKTLVLQKTGAQSTFRQDWYANADNPRLEVQCLPLEAIISANEISKIRLWKLDVEGTELSALLGARSLLEQKRIDAILLEISPESYAEVSDLLVSCDYELHRFDSSGRLTKVSAPPNGTTDLIVVPA
jgi:FkbM family methyltransferase